MLVLLLVALLHHSFGAEYDANQPITLTGTLTAIEWTNPHTHFYLDVKDPSGKVVNWKLEGYNPSVLVRTGWKRSSGACASAYRPKRSFRPSRLQHCRSPMVQMPSD